MYNILIVCFWILTSFYLCDISISVLCSHLPQHFHRNRSTGFVWSISFSCNWISTSYCIHCRERMWYREKSKNNHSEYSKNICQHIFLCTCHDDAVYMMPKNHFPFLVSILRGAYSKAYTNYSSCCVTQLTLIKFSN